MAFGTITLRRRRDRGARRCLPCQEQEEGDNEEPIPFADTVPCKACFGSCGAQVWNLTLVLGHSGAGWLDVFIACALALLGPSEASFRCSLEASLCRPSSSS